MRAASPQVLFVGTRGAFSGPPLAALLEAGFPVCAVLLPPARALPMLGEAPTIADVARARGIPVLESEQPGDERSLARLASFRPDLLCVACFPRALPPRLLLLPRLGCLNLHPSLLPRHRGPAPLFWTFYHDDAVAGVTVHIMTDRVDSGDLLLQAPVPIPDGTTGPDLERACATRGGALLVEAIAGWTGGTLSPRPQEEAAATAAPWPTRRDLQVPRSWTARRACRFIRGVGAWYPLTIALPGGTAALRMREALGVAEAGALPDEQDHRQVGDEAWVRFREGVLRVAVW